MESVCGDVCIFVSYLIDLNKSGHSDLLIRTISIIYKTSWINDTNQYTWSLTNELESVKEHKSFKKHERLIHYGT